MIQELNLGDTAIKVLKITFLTYFIIFLILEFCSTSLNLLNSIVKKAIVLHRSLYTETLLKRNWNHIKCEARIYFLSRLFSLNSVLTV